MPEHAFSDLERGLIHAAIIRERTSGRLNDCVGAELRHLGERPEFRYSREATKREIANCYEIGGNAAEAAAISEGLLADCGIAL